MKAKGAGVANNVAGAVTLSVIMTNCAAPEAGLMVMVPVYCPTANPCELMMAVKAVGVLPCVVLTVSQDPPLVVVAVAVNCVDIVPLARLITCREIAALLDAVWLMVTVEGLAVSGTEARTVKVTGT